ncbi:MAG: hypothetical protein RMJ57_06160 [Bacteroidia bacterium]|nr:hypothetical protein [Bacteroidia bacterium]
MLYLYRGPELDAWITRYGLNLTFFKVEEPILPLSPDLPFHEWERIEQGNSVLLGHRCWWSWKVQILTLFLKVWKLLYWE